MATPNNYTPGSYRWKALPALAQGIYNFTHPAAGRHTFKDDAESIYSGLDDFQNGLGHDLRYAIKETAKPFVNYFTGSNYQHQQSEMPDIAAISQGTHMDSAPPMSSVLPPAPAPQPAAPVAPPAPTTPAPAAPVISKDYQQVLMQAHPDLARAGSPMNRLFVTGVKNGSITQDNAGQWAHDYSQAFPHASDGSNAAQQKQYAASYPNLGYLSPVAQPRYQASMPQTAPAAPAVPPQERAMEMRAQAEAQRRKRADDFFATAGHKMDRPS